ncbi:formylglycine-generating enzyme family protein [Dysgonomonas termitidis]|uniref:Formylglycine-generating enzyme family protein n=1 Tax=Dysgonomonas termitidis TaxID=1516126 RepID=A0ABV9KYN6_9BACT
MKTYRLLMILAALLLGNIILPAQEGNDYLQKIESSLSQSDCKKAQLWYKAYKNVTNKTDAGIEKRIAACEGKVNIPNPPPLHSSEPAMVYVQGGTFTMGCTSEQGNDCYDNEKPAHRVTLSDFYIGKYEVTQANMPPEAAAKRQMPNTAGVILPTR